MTSIYTIHDLIKKPGSQLEKLVSTALALKELDQHFITVLDPYLISHCRVGYYDSGILTLFAENGCWATKLRYSVPHLLSTLRSHATWAGLRSIQIKVQKNCHPQDPSPPPPKPLLQPPFSLSEANIKALQHLADNLKNKPGSEKLVESLERLAKKKY